MRDYGSVSFLAAAEKRKNDFMKEQKKFRKDTYKFR